mgnify:FL=1|jgi:hypothetical protein|tara:strand:+ start:27 stop:665 length:639 start_codon:yes stop_codon:yes gene_type:complete
MTSILKVDTIQDADGNNIISENSNAVTIGKAADTVSVPGNATLGASGKTITIPSGCTITNNGTQSGFGGTNTPYWYAYGAPSGQATTSGTYTKATCTAVHDSGSNYDNSNYRWTCPSGQAGKYWVAISGQPYNTSSVADGAAFVPYKNGSSMGNTYFSSLYQVSNFRNHWLAWSGMIDVAAGDYLECYGYSNFPSGAGGIAYVKFGGYKIIE